MHRIRTVWNGWLLTGVFLLLLNLVPFTFLSQNTSRPDSSATAPATVTDTTKNKNLITPSPAPVISPVVTASFLFPEVTLEEGQIISNVLRIPPSSEKPFTFTIYVTVPGKWKVLGTTGKTYTTPDKDTLYIPIRVVPSGLKGNAQYFLAAVVRDENGKQRTSASFSVGTQKQTKWELNVFPSEKVYFPNNQSFIPFSLNVFNSGNEVQDILLTIHEIGKNSILSDSTGLILKKQYFNLTLGSLRDTTLKLRFSYFEGKRNFRRIDIENHNPAKMFEEKRYSLFFRTQDPKLGTYQSFSSNKRVDFIKLNSVKKVHPYDSYAIPLTLEANVYNVLGNQPIMNIVARGSTILDNGANMVYFSQVNYTNYFYNPYFLQSSSFYLGYFHTWGNVQIGDVSSGANVGIPVSGRGISGEYKLNDHHTLGAFFTMSPGLLNPYRKSYGLNYKYLFSDNKVFAASAGRIEDKLGGANTNFLGGRFGFNLNKIHQFGIMATGTQSTSLLSPPDPVRYGYLIGADYSASFLNQKLTPSVRLDYNSRYYANTNSERFSILQRTNYDLGKKRSLSLQDNYITYEAPGFVNGAAVMLNNISFTNFLYYSVYSDKGRVMPGLFYNYSDYNYINLHYRGVSFDFNTFNVEKNTRFSFSTRGGYNWLPDYPQIAEFFSLQTYALLQYHTFSFNARYNYGYQSIYDVTPLLNGANYPQVLYLSIQHQYLFADPRFVLQTNVNYSYQNTIFSHSFGLYPELYYYSLKGWRFKVNLGYSFNSSNTSRANLYQNTSTLPPTEQNNTPVISQGFIVGFGVKKDFGIPIPKKLRKKNNYTMEFVAFLDMNGNRIMDQGEIPLENVVIRIGDQEVITDAKGMARIVNISSGYYAENVFPLTDLQGWFPLVDDSVPAQNKTYYLPFIRGVKIFGDVVVERESFSDETPLDISRIKITAIDSLGKPHTAITDKKGNYVIYVPIGKYVITMDEKFLGDGFSLPQNNLPVTLRPGLENVYTPFYIIEKKRKVNLKKFTQESTEEKKEDKKEEKKDEKKDEKKPQKKATKKVTKQPVKKDAP
jgi:hypothetical protein